MGAQPVRLRLPYALLTNVYRLPSGSSTIDAENRAAASFLSRVRNLELLGLICDGPSGLARVLRAATRLEALSATRMEGDFLFAASPEELAGLVHPRLRSIDVWTLEASESIRADGVARLRRLCFPRLRRLAVGGLSPDRKAEKRRAPLRAG
jgi:hypothetical protein